MQSIGTQNYCVQYQTFTLLPNLVVNSKKGTRTGYAKFLVLAAILVEVIVELVVEDMFEFQRRTIAYTNSTAVPWVAGKVYYGNWNSKKDGPGFKEKNIGPGKQKRQIEKKTQLRITTNLHPREKKLLTCWWKRWLHFMVTWQEWTQEDWKKKSFTHLWVNCYWRTRSRSDET